MTLKVAVIGHSSELAGAELSLLFCVKRMVAQGFQVHVLLPKKGPLSEKIADLNSDIEIHYLPLRWWMGKRQRHVIGAIRTAQSLWDTFGVLIWLQNLKPQVAVTISSVTPAPLIASKILGIPNILTLGESLKSNATLKSFLPKKFIVWLINKCTFRVLACSRYVANQYALPSEVAYPEIEEFLVSKPSDRNLSKPTIVMLGSYSNEKGQDLAVEVARQLLEKDFNFRLDFYGWGDGKFLAGLERKVMDYGLTSVVTFKSQTTDAYSVFRQAALTFVLSKNEAFGKVTLESLSQGTPVIGLDAGGTSEILEEGGGILVEPEPFQIAQRIIDLCGSPKDYRQMQISAISNPILYQIVGTRRDICSHVYEAANLDKKAGQ
jgi:glycosyltransferase involved in cell wall biosynthesis